MNKTHGDDGVQALVVVPFHDMKTAEGWVQSVCASFPDHLPPIVTTGAEQIRVEGGVAIEEIVLTGGWRPISAGQGEIVIRRNRSN